MQIKFIYIKSSKEKWFDLVLEKYHKKIQAFTQFQYIEIKAAEAPKGKEQLRKTLEGQKILAQIKPSQFVVLFDEKGQSLSSAEFSTKISETFQYKSSEIFFIIGGAFGVSDEVKNRAQLCVQLSPFVLNHFVATTVALEQIYRAFSIWKSLPYHNE